MQTLQNARRNTNLLEYDLITLKTESPTWSIIGFRLMKFPVSIRLQSSKILLHLSVYFLSKNNSVLKL